MSSRELCILQPAISKPEELEELKEDRPFVMRGSVPTGAQFVQVLTIPTIVDMVGFSSGGGPPAFAYFVDPRIEGHVSLLWFMVGPGFTFDWLDDEPLLRAHFRGVVQSLGMLLGAVELSGPEHLIDAITGTFREAGSMVFQLIPYQIPVMFKRRAFPHGSRQEPAVR